MHFRTRCALGTAVVAIAALASGAPAQAQPTVCSSRAFRTLDAAVNANPRGVADVLAVGYRLAPRAALAEFDTLAQCDPAAALTVYDAFASINSKEANNFKAQFFADYPADAESVFETGPVMG